MLSLIKNNSIDHITVTDICHKAQIDRRTFYTHYNDKFTLLDAIMAQYLHDFENVCNKKKQYNFGDGISYWFGYIDQHQHVFNLFSTPSVSDMFQHKVELLLRSQIKQNLNSNYYSVDDDSTIVTFLASAILGSMLNYIKLPEEKKVNTINELTKLLEPYFK
ncbi:TetR/AcrR family transcriptional regulator [Staphylococcus simiae]|uniref:TetR/AcrR family transcriptional regulator n=1 Tax=Staphylococcus simiae TaxID=308354 RepID=UPI001A981564|nr:hypothetical protein [Staphylococcus simiae]